MLPDIELFDENPVAGDAEASGDAGTVFTAAANAVNTARSVTFSALVVPATAYYQGIQQEPVVLDGVYRWDYSVAGSGYEYLVGLSAQRMGNQSLWEMRVTSAAQAPPLDNFLWITGTASTAGEGEWHLFDATNPGTQTEILSVDWTYEFQANRRLILINVNPASPDVGDRVDFVADGFIRTLQYYDASTQAYALAQWSWLTHEGVFVATNFNGGEPACWNATLADVGCTMPLRMSGAYMRAMRFGANGRLF